MLQAVLNVQLLEADRYAKESISFRKKASDVSKRCL